MAEPESLDCVPPTSRWRSSGPHEWRFSALHPDFGVELKGVDLSGITGELVDALISAVFQHSVVVIRNQELTPAAQASLGKKIGTPKISARSQFQVPGHRELTLVGNVRNPDGTPAALLDRAGNLWHSDSASESTVDAFTFLYGVEIPSVGGETLFCSMHGAWDRLDQGMREFIDGRQVLHSFQQHNAFLAERNNDPTIRLSEEDKARVPDVWHPLVQTHPATGRSLYYLTPSLVKAISGLDDAECRALANRLMAHATVPEAVYSHAWREGDLVIWDNRAAMHSATPADYDRRGERRCLRRSYSYTDVAASGYRSTDSVSA